MEGSLFLPKEPMPSMTMPVTFPMRTFTLRAAMSFLVSALLLSGAALLRYVQQGNVGGAYTAGLSVIINFVAAYHYRAILKVRHAAQLNTAMSLRDEELEVDGLRHSDWLVTLPLLVLKLHYLIDNADQDLFFANAELSAFMAFLMILFGAFARLALDWGLKFGEMGDMQRMWVLGCYLVSIALLVVLLIDLGMAQEGGSTPSLIWSFFLVWIGYPIVAIGAFFARSTTKDGDSEVLSLFKDVSYALLDTYSKAVFAWWAASLAFNIRFLGS